MEVRVGIEQDTDAVDEGHRADPAGRVRPRVALDARERCQVNANGWSGRGGFAELELAKVSREWNTARSGAQFSGIASGFS